MSEPEQSELVARATRCLQAARLEEAESIGRELLQDPAFSAQGFHLLAHAAVKRGDDSAAITFLEQAIGRPRTTDGGTTDRGSTDGTIWTDLGFLYARRGRCDDALRTLSRAVELVPQLPEAWIHLADVHLINGKIPAAAEAYSRAVSLRPDQQAIYGRIGGNCENVELIDALFAACLATLRGSDFSQVAMTPAVWFNLAFAAQLRGCIDIAIAGYRRALDLEPGHLLASNNLGTALRDSGEIDGAIACFRHAAKSDASGIAHSNLLYLLHFQAASDPPALRAEHESWNLKYAAALLPDRPARLRPPARSSSQNGRIRIGYVSPDLCEHSVGRFLTQLFAHHDRSQFEIFGYSSVRAPDQITARLRASTDHWIDALELSEEALAERIRGDGIDILVDLTMHMRGSRLLCFARRPAPVQVTYLAYCSTTGVKAIDYRLTDPYLDPFDSAQGRPIDSAWDRPIDLAQGTRIGDDESKLPESIGRDAWYVERSVRLPRTYWCYEPGIATPEVNTLPALSRGFVTFASLNNFSKVTPAALFAWARILAETKNSRLLLHSHRGAHRRRVLDAFAMHGVAAERIVFVDTVPLADYFKLYQLVDIALDTFPYAGGTTTCDALWMGVPVISLVGTSAVSRGGLSILSNVGFAELAKISVEDYAAGAIELTADLSRLGQLRSALRPAMLRSPLMDGAGFARDVEACFRKMIADL